MKLKIFDLQGNESGTTQLPSQFTELVRSDLINRAFHAYASLFYQPKGTDPRAGLKTTAEYYGRRRAWRQTINTGRSRLPREKLPGGRLGRVLRVPHAAKGRRAHPPKIYKKIVEKINTKERNKAIRSALSACIDPDLVSTKHILAKQVPLVVVNDFESLKKTKDVLKTLDALGLSPDIERANNGRRKRTGIKRLRGRAKQVPRTVLVVIGEDKGVAKAASNIPGLQVAFASKLNASLLAPGGVPGRLTLWTQSALKQIDENNLYA